MTRITSPGAGHRRDAMSSEYRVLTPISLRSRYVSLTDNLIYLLEGHDGWIPDDVVYLDKSGRPVCWLVRALWRVLARSPGTCYRDNQVPTPPQARFVNIDREQWWHLTGGSETGNIDTARVPEDVIIQLRSVFANDPDHPEASSMLDDRRVLIVDEVANTGDTLRIARGLFEAAYPRSDVRTTHWMTPGSLLDRSGLRRTATVPVWYRSDIWQGRRIGNRLANAPHSRRGARGSLFLSTTPPEPDQLGRRLRAETSYLGRDVAVGCLLANPSMRRDDDDFDERIQALYGVTNPREFAQRRHDQNNAL
jgi:hypothetical protein